MPTNRNHDNQGQNDQREADTNHYVSCVKPNKIVIEEFCIGRSNRQHDEQQQSKSTNECGGNRKRPIFPYFFLEKPRLKERARVDHRLIRLVPFGENGKRNQSLETFQSRLFNAFT